VTLHYKALYITKKIGDSEDKDKFELGGRGFDKECCVFCDAVRVSTYWYSVHNVQTLYILVDLKRWKIVRNKTKTITHDHSYHASARKTAAQRKLTTRDGNVVGEL
jgi:hypothetical protein